VDLDDLKTALKRYGFDDDDPLAIWINASLHDIESRDDWRFLQMTSEGIVVPAGNNVVTTPADFLRPYKLRDTTEELDTGGVGYDLEYWDPRKWDRDIDNQNSQGKCEIYTTWGNVILVWRVPLIDTTFSLAYQRFLPDLVDGTDVPGIPIKFHYTIVLGAAYRALQAESEEERAQTAQGQFEADIINMIASYGSAQIGEPETVEDTMDYALEGYGN
jgi:hypothetical protein